MSITFRINPDLILPDQIGGETPPEIQPINPNLKTWLQN
ncbi:hypothetical protein LYNGBM3L_72380 [Moorena producens 3L]|uniref:Uncharacterized protein n=1 Tax=Moorena producens 3L TaxID=489825 RepID=F4Y3G3_9CYAN|nr:hypothetical protein LYNGBM3L_72380 [Moorena producens 3L]